MNAKTLQWNNTEWLWRCYGHGAYSKLCPPITTHNGSHVTYFLMSQIIHVQYSLIENINSVFETQSAIEREQTA